jgi:hypothetical protein
VGAKAFLPRVLILHLEDVPIRALNANPHDLPASPIHADGSRPVAWTGTWIQLATTCRRSVVADSDPPSPRRPCLAPLPLYPANGNGLLPNNVNRKVRPPRRTWAALNCSL